MEASSSLPAYTSLTALGDISFSLFCPNCLSKLDNLDNLGSPPVTGFHHSIASRLRAGFNLPISQGELAQINAFLTDVPETRARYDKAIEETEYLLASLKHARDGLQRRSDNARSLISSHIRKLPLDVLNEIFTFCCSQDEDGDEDGYSLSLKKGSPIFCTTLKLSWVCSFWRAAVRCRPQLWSSLRLSTWVFQSKPESFRILSEYLAFSANYPLNFRFAVENVGLWSSPKVPEATGALLGNSMRWRRATFKIPKTGAKQWFAYLGHFPVLEYLKLPDDIPWSDGLVEFFRTLSICPRLQTFHGSHFSWSRHNADFSHITELSLVSFIGKSLGHLLHRLPVLESLTVKAFQLSEHDADDTWLKRTGYHSSSLSKLSVTTWNLGPDAWRFVRLPRLTEITLITPVTAAFPDEMPSLHGTS
ncbi:hypothetical protein BT96DRAFT_984814 [Gymnopus androsaceus JB14]|uniref:F-box domain-containing protein n=1 Tax=Gymnopus androsaceus JB14 TaxID=1447944 RepID=A0A6A4IMX1_9AGAR|nr:hypothetical protein BT96DRAFT_984814 [Gymnopus androsaceus JB14]